MTVYVDDSRNELGRMLMSHMIADGDVELHAMAETIGISLKWHQKPPVASHSHYDICQSKREAAIAAGAVPITKWQCAAMVARRNATGELCSPEDSERWIRDQLRGKRAYKTPRKLW